MNDESARPPATIGELRRRLERLGQPWTIPARFSDDDPLPDPPRGGEPVEPGHIEGLRAVDSQDELETILREVQPTNPFLAERWQSLGVDDPGSRSAAVPPKDREVRDGDVSEGDAG